MLSKWIYSVIGLWCFGAIAQKFEFMDTMQFPGVVILGIRVKCKGLRVFLSVFTLSIEKYECTVQT